jgi:hypothetical protein
VIILLDVYTWPSIDLCRRFIKSIVKTISTAKTNHGPRVVDGEQSIFNAITCNWLAIAEFAIEQRAAPATHLSANNRSFLVTLPNPDGAKQHTIPLHRWFAMVRKNTADLVALLSDLLPDGDSLSRLQPLMTNAAEDYVPGSDFFLYSPTSSEDHAQKDLLRLLRACQLEYTNPDNRHHLYHRDGQVNKASLEGFNQKNVAFLHALQVELLINTNVSPRHSSMVGYTYREQAGQERSIKKYANHFLAGWANSKAGERRGKACADIHVLTPTSGQIFYLYLSVPRVALSNAGASSRTIVAEHLQAINTHVFADLENGVWQTSRLRDHLARFTAQHLDGAALRDLHCRSMLTGLLRALLPIWLRKAAYENAVEQAGDHRHRIAANHYGQKTSLPVDYGDPAPFILISYIYHAAVGTGSVDDRWPEDVLKNPMLATTWHRCRAEQQARSHALGCFTQGGQTAILSKIERLDFFLNVSIDATQGYGIGLTHSVARQDLASSPA